MATHIKKELAQKTFIKWMGATHPALLKAAESKIIKTKPVTSFNPSKFGYDPKRSPPFVPDYRTMPFKKCFTMSGMGEGGGWGDFFTELTQNVIKLAPQYVQYKQQNKMLDIQVARARQGLPPTNMGPQPVQTKAQQSAPIESPQYTRAGGGVTNMTPMLIGVGILAAVFLLKKKRR